MRDRKKSNIIWQGSGDMKEPSTIISGVRRPTPCDVASAHLAKDVYNDSGAPAGWHRVGGPYENEGTGFYAQLYAPDGFEEELKLNPRQRPKLCPPVLAFRGTKFEDTRMEIVEWTDSPHKNPSEWLIVRTDTIDLYKGFIDRYDENIINDPRSMKDIFGDSKFIGVKIKGGDWANNFLIALGKMAEQYKDADKAAAAVDGTMYGPYVNYTGHSLGGGLAARVGIDKKKNTVTFNSAGVQRNPANNINPATARNCTNYWVTDEIVTTLQENPSRLPLSRVAFFLAKQAVITSYNGFKDLPDAAGSKVNLRMEPIRQPGHVVRELIGNTGQKFMEKQAANQVNKYIDNAMNQYGQGILLGNSNLGGGPVGVPRFEPIERSVIKDGIAEYFDDVAPFYKEAIRRHSMDVVLSLMKAR